MSGDDRKGILFLRMTALDCGIVVATFNIKRIRISCYASSLCRINQWLVRGEPLWWIACPKSPWYEAGNKKQTQFFFPIRGKGHLSYPTTHSWLIIHIASHDLTTVPGIQEMQRRSGEKLGRIFNVVLLVNLIGLKLRHRNLHITHCWLETSKYTKLVRLVGTLGGNGNCSWHWCRQASMIWFVFFSGIHDQFCWNCVKLESNVID